jgi:hypothetical protein
MATNLSRHQKTETAGGFPPGFQLCRNGAMGNGAVKIIVG